MLPDFLDLTSLRSLYVDGLSPVAAMEALAARMKEADPAIFITPVEEAALRAEAEALLRRAPEPNSLPLWGIPFAVKDNIDVAALPTTAACPAFAFTPVRDAFAVARLKAAGAIVTGKTNLDQFATGLNGTRSPLRCAALRVRRHLHLRRLEFWLGRGCRRRASRLRARHGYGRLGPRTRRPQQYRRDQADPGPRQRHRPAAGLSQPRHDQRFSPAASSMA